MESEKIKQIALEQVKQEHETEHKKMRRSVGKKWNYI